MEKTEHVALDLTLDQVVKGERVLENPSCHFTYDWDKETNTGIGQLHTINGSPVNIVLHPLGIKGELDFMSDLTEPTHYIVNASNDESIALIDVTINRVILDADADGGKGAAAIMFGQHGENILASNGFMEQSAAKQLPEVQFETPEAPAE